MLQKSSKPNFQPPATNYLLSLKFFKSYPAKLHGVREQYAKIWHDWEEFQNLVKNCVQGPYQVIQIEM